MIIMDSNYVCTLSKITFKHIIDSLSSELKAHSEDEERAIFFVDGDSNYSHSIINSVYEMRKSGKIVYMVTLISEVEDCSAVLRHFSDYVVDKKITCDDLKRLITSMWSSEPKLLTDNIFGDISVDIFNSSHKEYRVLGLLLEGYSQHQISQILNLSTKTISSYKVRAVKRHGARNFNELYMLKFHNLYKEI